MTIKLGILIFFVRVFFWPVVEEELSFLQSRKEEEKGKERKKKEKMKILFGCRYKR